MSENKKFTKNGEVVEVKANSVKKHVEFLEQEGVRLITRLDNDVIQQDRVLIIAIDKDGNEKNIGYVKDSLAEYVPEGEKPQIGKVTLKEKEMKEGKIYTLTFEFEIQNSIKFLEEQNKDIEVTLVSSTMFFKNSASALENVTNEIERFGKVQVKGEIKGDKLIAVYKDIPFATVKASDDVVESLIELAEANQLVFSVLERNTTQFKAKVVKPKELEILNISEEINRVSKVIVERGILSEEKLTERIDYLNGCESVRKNQVLAVLNFLNDMTEEEVANLIIPEKPETLFIDYEYIVSDIIDGAMVGDNILLAGPKSVGKNVAIETFSWLLLLPVGELTLNPQTSNENLYGAPTVKNDNGVPITVFEMTALVSAYIGESTRFPAGGISLSDEINAAPSATMMPMQAAWDWRKHIEIPNFKKVHKHRRSLSFATMNPGYLSMKPLNEAIADRYNTTIFMENGIDFFKVLEREHGENLNIDLAKKLAELYKQFFDMVNEADLDMDSDVEIDDKVLTIRGFKSAYNKIENGQDFVRAVRNSILNKVTDRETRAGLMEVVQDKFGK